MSKLPLFLLLASAAVPAFAAPGDDDRSNGRHHRNADATEESASQPERVRETQRSDTMTASSARSGPSGRTAARQASRMRWSAILPVTSDRASGAPRRPRASRTMVMAPATGAATATRNNQAQSGSWQPRDRHVRTIPDTNPTEARDGRRGSGEVARTFTGRSRPDYRNGNYSRWTNNWRNDRRYDWTHYRNSHRSIFRLGNYYDPFGWSYRRWSIGSMLYPSYYGSDYWLNDPWQYRLPPAYGPYRWVRYWDDALLVNIYTGQVADVLHNFFW
jgi:hypothetical protein